MKKLVLVVAVAAALYGALGRGNGPLGFTTPATTPATTAPATATASDAIGQAFAARQRGVQVAGEGRVASVLPDDNDGSRHQRFILRLASGQTVLVAHNIDLAPRIPALKSGDSVAFHGVYEWNAKGGVVHWTHRDPKGQHAAGWLRHAGQQYQ